MYASRDAFRVVQFSFLFYSPPNSLSLKQVLWSPSILKEVEFSLVLTTQNHERRLTKPKHKQNVSFCQKVMSEGSRSLCDVLASSATREYIVEEAARVVFMLTRRQPGNIPMFIIKMQ